MTMFKDPVTGEVLNGKPWKNPFTGAMNVVKPNVIGSKTLYRVEADGRIIGTSVDKEARFPMPPMELKLSFLEIGDKLQITGQRSYPEKRPIPMAEYGTTTAELALSAHRRGVRGGVSRALAAVPRDAAAAGACAVACSRAQDGGLRRAVGGVPRAGEGLHPGRAGLGEGLTHHGRSVRPIR
jgi:hypothetical protein